MAESVIITVETIDLIQKLLALATNNPNEEEAKLAALKAAQLIVESAIPLGKVGPVRKRSTWTTAEETEFKEALDAMLARRPDEFTPETTYPSFDIDDGFMKTRITEAWRKIRACRAEVERYYRSHDWAPPNWKG